MKYNSQKTGVKLRELLSSEEEIFMKEIQVAFDKAVIVAMDKETHCNALELLYINPD